MKLSIICAMAHRPKLLILDEATTGLDPVVRDEVLDLFLEFIQDEEHSLFFSSHIISDIEKIADYVILIHQGRIIFEEQKDNLIYNFGIAKCRQERFTSISSDDCLMAFVPRVIGFWLITAMSFMTMCVSTMFTVSIYTVVQQRTPIHLLGKIMASIIAIASCSQPIGQALYGILFEKLYAMPWTVMIGAAIVAFCISILSKGTFYRLSGGWKYV